MTSLKEHLHKKDEQIKQLKTVIKQAIQWAEDELAWHYLGTPRLEVRLKELDFLRKVIK